MIVYVIIYDIQSYVPLSRKTGEVKINRKSIIQILLMHDIWNTSDVTVKDLNRPYDGKLARNNMCS